MFDETNPDPDAPVSAPSYRVTGANPLQINGTSRELQPGDVFQGTPDIVRPEILSFWLQIEAVREE